MTREDKLPDSKRANWLVKPGKATYVRIDCVDSEIQKHFLSVVTQSQKSCTLSARHDYAEAEMQLQKDASRQGAYTIISSAFEPSTENNEGRKISTKVEFTVRLQSIYFVLHQSIA